jgi:hypothetical protein
MIRTRGLAVAIGLAAIAVGPAPQSVPPACQLLTAQEASNMMGVAEVVNPNDLARSDFNCRYNPPNNAPMSFDGVDITTKTLSDGPAAHAYFPRWLVPFPPMPVDMTLTPVQGVGDEASITHGKIVNAISFRAGAVLVKMGTRPAPSDSALIVAGKIMAGRLGCLPSCGKPISNAKPRS